VRQLIPAALILSSLALGAGVAACNDTAYRDLGGPTDQPDGPMVTINGTVTDSVLGGGIGGARVAAGRFVTYADADGQWSLAVPQGTVTLSSSPVGYERVSYTFEAIGPTNIDLLARRLAPIVQQCVRDGDKVIAMVSDLQGRKTIERWNESQVLILDPAGPYFVSAINWGYQAVDILTWQITLGPISAATTEIHWYVYDNEGHTFSGICEPTEVGPLQ
jgi:hypothetical protein